MLARSPDTTPREERDLESEPGQQGPKHNACQPAAGASRGEVDEQADDQTGGSDFQRGGWRSPCGYEDDDAAAKHRYESDDHRDDQDLRAGHGRESTAAYSLRRIAGSRARKPS